MFSGDDPPANAGKKSDPGTVFVGFIFLHSLCKPGILYTIISPEVNAMFTYISFFNKSSNPVLIIFLDDTEVEELLGANQKSRMHITEAGSHTVLICDSKNLPLFDLWLPLYPNKFYTLIIEDSSVFLSEHLS